QDDGGARSLRGRTDPHPQGRSGGAGSPLAQGVGKTMPNGPGTIMEHRLDAEGADHLMLAGVNDQNFQELTRIFGIRIVLRGDNLVLSGDSEGVERAVPLAQHLIELARLRAPFDVNDISRFADSFEAGGGE